MTPRSLVAYMHMDLVELSAPIPMVTMAVAVAVEMTGETYLLSLSSPTPHVTLSISRSLAIVLAIGNVGYRNG